MQAFDVAFRKLNNKAQCSPNEGFCQKTLLYNEKKKNINKWYSNIYKGIQQIKMFHSAFILFLRASPSEAIFCLNYAMQNVFCFFCH